MLTDDGLLGVKTVNTDNVVEFHKIEIIQDTINGIWVKGIPQFSNLIDSAPDALNTLNELAEALNDDENYAATIQNQLATKQNNLYKDL